MVPFYGTVYKSILYDLIIPFPACESGAEQEKRRAVVFASGPITLSVNLSLRTLKTDKRTDCNGCILT